jgi:hypothetical protein
MGGLIAQKLVERGVGRAAVLITPASPVDARSGSALAQAVTFGNVLFSGKPETKPHKIWATGFKWGVLNRVPAARHAEIYATAVYDSGGVYNDLAYPDKDEHGMAVIDETRVTVPLLTIGGAKDRATPIADVRRVGAKYGRVGGDYLEYPNNAHWIIDEPGTDQVIADIAAWLANNGLTADPPTVKAPTAKKAAPAKAKATARSAAKTPVKAPGKAKAAAKASPAPVVADPVAPPPAKAAAKPKAAPKAEAAPAPAAKKPAAKKAATSKAAAKPATKAKAASASKPPAKKPKS